jgi:hypothetical protein
LQNIREREWLEREDIWEKGAAESKTLKKETRRVVREERHWDRGRLRGLRS